MVIAGLIKSSLIDYPGKVSAVIFTQGCNFGCGFCHNPDLVPRSEASNSKFQIPTGADVLVSKEKVEQKVGPFLVERSNLFEEDGVLEFLETRRGKLDGVVITGGEPTLQKDLIEFIKKLKEMDYSVKLDTNGSSPSVLKNLITEQLIDYVAMDIKNSPVKYQQTCGYPFSKQIAESIKLIMNSGIDYEFRTTVLPFYHKMKDFEEIGKLIKGAKKYTIQGFRDENLLDKNLMGAKKFTRDELKELQTVLEKYVKKVDIRENL